MDRIERRYQFTDIVAKTWGRHAFKFGVQDMFGTRQFTYDQNNSQYWIFNQGAPLGLYQYAWPLADAEHLKSALGVYAQDRWTIRNLTLNYGVRLDYHNDPDNLRNSFLDLTLRRRSIVRLLRFLRPQRLVIGEGFPTASGRAVCC